MCKQNSFELQHLGSCILHLASRILHLHCGGGGGEGGGGFIQEAAHCLTLDAQRITSLKPSHFAFLQSSIPFHSISFLFLSFPSRYSR